MRILKGFLKDPQPTKKKKALMARQAGQARQQALPASSARAFFGGGDQDSEFSVSQPAPILQGFLKDSEGIP